jgi:hypothetical protein
MMEEHFQLKETAISNHLSIVKVILHRILKQIIQLTDNQHKTNQLLRNLLHS